ncbi:MAG: tetratricopeptide repeat protein, partial [Candidatus Riflebacteria bacterium]
AGYYRQAILTAGKFIEISPDSVDAMLIIAMSHFNEKDYVNAREWFRKVARQKPRNPIARKYIALIQEIEHRYGPFSNELSQALVSNDHMVSTTAFKKGWFGHGFPEESKPTVEYFDSDKNIPAPIAIEVPAPVEKVLMETSVANMAQDAFKNQMFLKSYLFYSQLLSASPGNRNYLLRKAESALKLERYAEVVKILGPVMLARDEKSFSPEELKLADELLLKARKQISD